MKGFRVSSNTSLVIFLTLLLIVILAECKEYCQFEYFNASCSTNQVIVMEEAQYGRLQVGRCVTRDYGFLGCSANVIDLLDRTCSGQRWCQFGIPTLRDLVQPCPKDLTVYLEATYRCVTILKTNHMRCNETIYVNSSSSSLPSVMTSSSTSSMTSSITSSFSSITSVASSSVYISATPYSASAAYLSPPPSSSSSSSSSSYSSSYSSGSVSVPFSPVCPLLIRARPGQRLNFTLYSLSVGQGSSSSNDYDQQTASAQTSDELPSRLCPSLVVVENGRRYSSPLCQIRPREQHLHTTNDSSVSFYFSIPTQRSRPPPTSTSGVNTAITGSRSAYYLKIEAIGCADLVLPGGGAATLERTDDRLIVRCNSTQETWYMTCKGHAWIGSVANCTHAALPINGISDGNVTAKRSNAVPLGLFMAIIIGIILGVVCGVAMLISVFIYRRHRLRRRHYPPKSNSLLLTADAYDAAVRGDLDAGRRQVTTHVYGGGGGGGGSGAVCPVHSTLPLYTTTDYTRTFDIPHSFYSSSNAYLHQHPTTLPHHHHLVNYNVMPSSELLQPAIQGLEPSSSSVHHAQQGVVAPDQSGSIRVQSFEHGCFARGSHDDGSGQRYGAEDGLVSRGLDGGCDEIMQEVDDLRSADAVELSGSREEDYNDDDDDDRSGKQCSGINTLRLNRANSGSPYLSHDRSRGVSETRSGRSSKHVTPSTAGAAAAIEGRGRGRLGGSHIGSGNVPNCERARGFSSGGGDERKFSAGRVPAVPSSKHHPDVLKDGGRCLYNDSLANGGFLLSNGATISDQL